MTKVKKDDPLVKEVADLLGIPEDLDGVTAAINLVLARIAERGND